MCSSDLGTLVPIQQEGGEEQRAKSVDVDLIDPNDMVPMMPMFGIRTYPDDIIIKGPYCPVSLANILVKVPEDLLGLEELLPSPSHLQWYVVNMQFRVRVVLIQIIVLLLSHHLLPTLIILGLLTITHIIRLNQLARNLLIDSMGPVAALTVAVQNQLQVAQAVGPQLDRDIQAYLQLVGEGES